jgi:hypothetical protein
MKAGRIDPRASSRMEEVYKALSLRGRCCCWWLVLSTLLALLLLLLQLRLGDCAVLRSRGERALSSDEILLGSIVSHTPRGLSSYGNRKDSTELRGTGETRRRGGASALRTLASRLDYELLPAAIFIYQRGRTHHRRASCRCRR